MCIHILWYGVVLQSTKSNQILGTSNYLSNDVKYMYVQVHVVSNFQQRSSLVYYAIKRNRKHAVSINLPLNIEQSLSVTVIYM